MFQKIKSWDNRNEARRHRQPTVDGRTWTKRAQWLEDGEGRIKFKFWDGPDYYETLVAPAFAQKVWDRLKEGQSWHDAVSIFAANTPAAVLSRKAAELANPPVRRDGGGRVVVRIDDRRPSLKEAQSIVGGYVQMLTLRDKSQMLMNEDGRALNLPINPEASALAEHFGPIRGSVLILSGKARWGKGK